MRTLKRTGYTQPYHWMIPMQPKLPPVRRRNPCLPYPPRPTEGARETTAGSNGHLVGHLITFGPLLHEHEITRRWGGLVPDLFFQLVQHIPTASLYYAYPYIATIFVFFNAVEQQAEVFSARGNEVLVQKRERGPLSLPYQYQ